MTPTQVLGVALVALAALGIWLEMQCKLGAVLKAIYEGDDFGPFVVSLIIFMAILSIIGEPNSTRLAIVVILGMLAIDRAKNGNNDIWAQLGITG